jgi:hypothetical protein
VFQAGRAALPVSRKHANSSSAPGNPSEEAAADATPIPAVTRLGKPIQLSRLHYDVLKFPDRAALLRTVHRDRRQPLGVTVSHETVPDAGVSHPLSLGQAALAAGVSLRTLKAFTDKFEGTADDLRAPGSESPVRYDPERLSAWLRRRNSQQKPK